MLGHTVLQSTRREPRRGGRGLNAMPTERPVPRDIVALTTAPEAERTKYRVAAERLLRGVIEKPRESDATRILVVGTNVLGERENYWLGEGSSEGEKWSRVRDGEEKGSEVGNVREGVVVARGGNMRKGEHGQRRRTNYY